MSRLASADIRLVVCDMDGTLLGSDHSIPERLWPLLTRIRERGALFAPASGRQYATLRRMFERAAEGTVFIAENGTLVMRDGQELSSTTIDERDVDAVVRTVRGLSDLDVGVVAAGKRGAYIERHDPTFRAIAETFSAALQGVDDVLAVDDEIVKIAVYDFGDAETGIYEALRTFEDRLQVVVSGRHWLDLMAPGANKGTAVRALQSRLGIGPDQTLVFGDYLNDLEMMGTATWSFAMANAHPAVAAAANFRAPANTEEGVITVLLEAFGDGKGPGPSAEERGPSGEVRTAD